MKSRTFILVAALLTILGFGVGGLYVWDASREDIIADGMEVNNVDLSGLTPEQARAKLTQSVLVSLDEPVVVKRGKKEFTLTPERARVTVNVDAMVEEALDRSRRGGIFSRTWRALTGDEAHANISPQVTYSERVVDRFVDKISRKLNRAPRNATIQPDQAELTKVGSLTGLRVRASQLRKDIGQALAAADVNRTIKVSVKKVEPEVTTQQLAQKYPVYLIVDRNNFKLRYYRKLKLKKTYNVAIGAVGRETPPGLYDIQNKQVDPVWSVPNSDWAGELAGQQIPPGPNNPLKARWLGIYNGVGIHGTAERDSIGTNASKGCIRMLVEDVIDLYPRIPVGTPVYIA